MAAGRSASASRRRATASRQYSAAGRPARAPTTGLCANQSNSAPADVLTPFDDKGEENSDKRKMASGARYWCWRMPQLAAMHCHVKYITFDGAQTHLASGNA